MDNLDYLNSLPNDSEYVVPERIVCAANKYGNVVLAGVRHGCDNMFSLYELVDGDLQFDACPCSKEEQGFLTNKHRFVDRKEAWKIALEQKQIVRLVGGNLPQGVLYSENLY